MNTKELEADMIASDKAGLSDLPSSAQRTAGRVPLLGGDSYQRVRALSVVTLKKRIKAQANYFRENVRTARECHKRALRESSLLRREDAAGAFVHYWSVAHGNANSIRLLRAVIADKAAGIYTQEARAALAKLS